MNREQIEQLVEEFADTGRLASDHQDLAEQQLRNLSILSRIASSASTGSEQQSFDRLAEHKRWGQLHLIEEIGAGGFATVYRAYDPRLERDVALKLILPKQSLLVDTQAYINEAKRLARVRHPNVLAIHGVAEHKGLAGIWVDLVDGPTLEQTISATGPLSVSDFLGVAIQLAGALRAIHDAGLVHGDIKPSNVLIDDTHGAVLADFGAAAESSAMGDASIVQATQAFMAPEMLDTGRASSASDIYAMGLLYCHLLTGELPTDERPPQSTETPWQGVANPAIRKLLKSMLNSAPATRPTANDLVDQLQVIEQRPQRRAKTLALTAILVALGAIGLAALLAWQSSQRALKQTTEAMTRSEAVKDFLVDALQRSSPIRSDSRTSVSDLLRSASASIGERFADSPMVRADLQLALGQALLAWGDGAKAQPLLIDAAQVYASAGAVDSALRAEMSVARAVDDRLERLRALQALRSRIEDGEATPATQALYWARLGGVLSSENQMEQASDAFRRAEAIWEALDSPVVADRGLLHLDWGGHSWRMSNYQSAADHATTARDIFLEVYGLYNNNMLSANTNLAHAMIRLGQLDQAEAVLKEAVEQSKRLFGDMHERTLSTINSRAGVLLEQGRDAEALPLYEALMVDVEQRSEPWALDAISVVINYANNLRYLGYTTEAEAAYIRVINASKGRTGTGEIQHALAKHNYAELLLSIGRLADGLVYQNEALATFQTVFPDDHLFVLEAQENLAWHQMLAGHTERALQRIESILESKAQQFGNSDLFTLEAFELKADTLLSLGQTDEARALYQTILDERNRQLGSEHRATRQVAAKLPVGTSP